LFERYTEQARRVIFFARYEASQFGSSHIETEHLLLGLAREQRWVLQLIPDLQIDSLRARIETLVSVGKEFPTSVDLPLSNECKRVLAYAAEEAERLASHTIAPAHLLLGLLRETGGLAAKILTESGANLPKLRLAIANLPTEKSDKMETIHGRPYPSRYIESAAAQARTYFWSRKKFVAPDIVLHRADKRISFDLGLGENMSEFELVPHGWQQTRCLVCMWEFAESDDSERGTGYTNGRDWICTECHDRFLVAPTAGA
jgi:Clp amino terminal domain, pathogenicity island component